MHNGVTVLREVQWHSEALLVGTSLVNTALVWLGLAGVKLHLPAEHTGRQHLLGLQGTSGAGHAKPECQSGGFPGPFVCCQVRTACSVQCAEASVVAASRLHLEHLLKWNKENADEKNHVRCSCN